MPAPLYLCLHVPHFILQSVISHHPEHQGMPLAILDGPPPNDKVVSASRQAADKGLYVGMSGVEASRVGKVIFVVRTAREEEVTKAELLRFALQFSPLVEDYSWAGECTLVLDIRASLGLFGDDKAISSMLMDSAASIHVYGNTVVSSNFLAAVCMARSLKADSSSVFIPDGSERRFLERLPIGLLPLMEEQHDTLTGWGIHSFGELASLPLDQLVSRLGPDGRGLSDMARGVYKHHFSPLILPSELGEATSFDTPVGLIDSLMFAISPMLRSIAERVAESFVSITAITLTFGLDCSQQAIRSNRTASPTNDTKVWLKLIHLDLLAHPLDDAVVSIFIKAETGSASRIQLGLFSPQLPETNRLAVTLARIKSIVGEDNAGAPILINSHVPDAFTLADFRVPGQDSRQAERVFVRLCLRRKRPALRIIIRIKNKILHSFVLDATRYIVTAAYGPWNSDHGWWSAATNCRVDWDVVARRSDNDGLLCCCLSYSEVDHSWYLEGTYD